MTDQLNQGGSQATATARQSPPSVQGLFAQRRMAAEQQQGEAQHGQAESPPAAVAPAPSGGAPEPQPPQDGGQAQEPASLTGAETDEELTSQGIGSPSAHERIRELGRAKNEAEARAQALESRLEALEARFQSGDKPNRDEAPEPPRGPELQPYPEPYPKDGTYEEQEAWERDSRVWEMSQRVAASHNQELISALGEVVGPIVADFHGRQREEAWGRVTPILEQMGVARDEVEPSVVAMLKANPSLNLEGAVYQAIAYNKIPVAERVQARAAPAEATPPEVVNRPGAGRVDPNAGNKPTAVDPVEQLRLVAETSRGKGREGMTQLFSALRQAGAVRQQVPGQTY